MYATSTTSSEQPVSRVQARDPWQAFVAAAQDLLGPDGASTDPETLASYGMNLTELSSRVVPVVVWPRTRDQVAELVALANEHGCPLYPISRGCNWGLGSRLPVVDGCALVDLSRMATILEVNERLGYAVIEPGVTQGQLARYLTKIGSSHILNVTGAGPMTSIVGNTLDRGVGNQGQRTLDLRGMEVVLGNGRTVRTGYWHFQREGSAPVPHFYAHGVGPDLNGLFCQSNYGIVTALVIGLRPKLQRRITTLLTCDEEKMPAMIDALYGLVRDGIVQMGVEVDSMNDHRFGEHAHGVTKDRQWFAWANVTAVDAMLDAATDVLRERVLDIAHTVEIFDSASPSSSEFPLHPSIRLGYRDGQPSAFSVQAFGGAEVADLDENDIDLDKLRSAPGLSVVLPAVPFDGQWVARLAALVEEVGAEHGLEPAVTVSGIGPTALEGFIRLGFDRSSPESVEKVHRWNDEMHRRLEEIGLFTYRASVNRMEDLVDRPKDTFWQTVSDLKRALDPRGIISPGRYAPR